jgi:periplasmic protein TonB
VAFESFRAQDRREPRRQRRVAFALVVAFHGVLIAAGVVYSFWHVEELTPPTVRVTFMSMAPPPPPPPPPPRSGGGSRPKKVAVKTKPPEPVPVKPPEIVQPPDKVKPVKKEFRKHEDEYVEPDSAKEGSGPGKGVGKGVIDGEDDGDEDGVAGGQRGGVIGGTIGGTGTTPGPPRSMPTQFGALQKISGELPPLPPSLNRGDLGYVVEARICVSPSGAVDSVTVTKASDALLNDGVTRSVRTWRFRPLRFNGIFVGFCYPGRFEFNSHR